MPHHEGPDYVLIGINQSEGRRGPLFGAWKRAGDWFEPYVTEGWTVEECFEVLNGPLSPDGWIELARLFADDFTPAG